MWPFRKRDSPNFGVVMGERIIDVLKSLVYELFALILRPLNRKWNISAKLSTLKEWHLRHWRKLSE